MTVTQQTDGRASRYADRREQLVGQLLEHLVEHGVAEVSLRGLAQAVGSTHSALLRHFGTREELLFQVYRRLHREDHEGAQALLTDTPGREQLHAAWERWTSVEQMARFRLLFELYGLALREPDRYRPLLDLSVNAVLARTSAHLRALGVREPLVEPLATMALAQFRGLVLDLQATGDRERVDAAFALWTDTLDHLVASAQQR